jgi:hypothetical protein
VNPELSTAGADRAGATSEDSRNVSRAIQAKGGADAEGLSKKDGESLDDY